MQPFFANQALSGEELREKYNEITKQVNDKYAIEKQLAIKDAINASYERIKKAVGQNKLIKLSFNKFTESDGKGTSAGESMSRGLVATHAYSVCGYEEENGIRYLRLINPWSFRIGRIYNKHNKKGKGYSFEGKGDESFRVKCSTILKHMRSLTLEQ